MSKHYMLHEYWNSGVGKGEFLMNHHDVDEEESDHHPLLCGHDVDHTTVSYTPKQKETSTKEHNHTEDHNVSSSPADRDDEANDKIPKKHHHKTISSTDFSKGVADLVNGKLFHKKHSKDDEHCNDNKEGTSSTTSHNTTREHRHGLVWTASTSEDVFQTHYAPPPPRGCLKIKSQDDSLQTTYPSCSKDKGETTLLANNSDENDNDNLRPINDDMIKKSSNSVLETSEVLEDANSNTPSFTDSSSSRSQLMKEKPSDRKKETRFEYVEIRYYPVVLSENPGSHGKGPSIEIGWEYFEHPMALKVGGHVPIDIFERTRRQKRRYWVQMRLSSKERYQLLRRLGYSNDAIIQASYHIDKIKAERLESMLCTEEQDNRQEWFNKMFHKMSSRHEDDIEHLLDEANQNARGSGGGQQTSTGNDDDEEEDITMANPSPEDMSTLLLKNDDKHQKQSTHSTDHKHHTHLNHHHHGHPIHNIDHHFKDLIHKIKVWRMEKNTKHHTTHKPNT